MSDTSTVVKPSQTLAPLRNVAGFMQLVRKLQNRSPTLPNIGVVSGYSGLGKTQGSIYAQNKTRAVRVEVGDSWNRRTFLKAVLREAEVAEPRGAAADLAEQAIYALCEQPNRPLIVDEADKLVDKGLIELVRELAEHSQVPVVLIGEEMLPHKLERFERVHNRVLSWFQALPADLADCRALASVFLPGIEIDDALLDAAREAGQGRARRVVVSMDDMREFAIANNIKRLDLQNYHGQLFTGAAPSARSGRFAKTEGRAAK